jgi:hypothetical protein
MKNKQHTTERVPIKQLKLAKYNPRKISKKELQKLADSIERYGLVQPILVNKDYTIIGGHQRVSACRLLGYKEVDVIVVDLEEEDEKALNIALNKISGDWNESALYELLSELAEKNKMALTGFEHKELDRLRFKQSNQINRKLIDDYIVPPFSILDAKQGYWQDRKRDWIAQIGNSGEGRGDTLISEGLSKLADKGAEGLTGTSIFDPVLCEIMYTWYADKGATIIDPFAGGHVRGTVASILGYKYIGTDVSKVQVQANQTKAKELGEKGATWHVADGADLNKYVKEKADLLFTCPPYYDLEIYDADNEKDISNAESYEQFREAYSKILINTYNMLKPSAWAIIVVGNIRDKEGNYYNLVGDTVSIMQEAGYHFYNEAILATAIGTATLRARKTFSAKKKLVKTHQNVLFFTKGREVAVSKTLRTLLEEGRTAVAHTDILVFKK